MLNATVITILVITKYKTIKIAAVVNKLMARCVITCDPKTGWQCKTKFIDTRHTHGIGNTRLQHLTPHLQHLNGFDSQTYN